MKIEQIEKKVEATLAIEGKTPSTEGKETTKKFLKGEITSEEAIKRIKSHWGVNT